MAHAADRRTQTIEDSLSMEAAAPVPEKRKNPGKNQRDHRKRQKLAEEAFG